MPQYAWTCHVCGSANDASHERCASCDCPAFASGKEILARKEVRKSDVLVPGSNKKPSAAVVSLFLCVVCVALLYIFGWYVAGKGADSDLGFIALVASLLLAFGFGMTALVGASVIAWKMIRRAFHNAHGS